MRRHNQAPRYGPKEIGARSSVPQSSGPSPQKRRRKPKGRRRGSSVGPLALMVLVLVAVLYGIYSLASALFGGGDKPVTVTVEKGDTLSSVAAKLDETGVIRSSTLFKLEARIQNVGAEIKPGEYQFEPGEDADEIFETLASGDSISILEATIPEGLTLEQTAQVIEEGTGIHAAEFEEAALETGYGYAFLEDPAVKTTEGFLFPKKYEVERDTDAAQVVDRLLEQYLIETRDLDIDAAQDRFNLTEYELVTVASLIEEESANPEERPIIASVIYNRLRNRMPLQVDATIQYVLGKPKEDLSLSDLEVDSPYNTYTNRGLPPSPISSPGREAIQAALEPARTDYLYYVLETDGERHFFTNDYDEFLEAKSRAER